jgi:hypothetical protein
MSFRMRLVGLTVLAWALLSPCAARADGQNLLSNPGFEQPLPGHPWMPTDWDTSSTGLPSVFFGRDTLAPHSGRYSANVANVSTLIPMAFNWSQAVVVGPEAWNQEAVFNVWTRSNGLEGRAYVLLQAYRDTASKMSLEWKLPREEALRRIGIRPIDDPALDLGWRRLYFSDSETGWVQREVRVFVPPSVNVLFVRCGVMGTGQVVFDDASLTLEPAPAQPEIPLNTNLIADPGFEGDGNAWEYSQPPYPGVRVELDTTLAHSGRASLLLEGKEGLIESRAGACQVFCNHGLAGKRVRLSAWVRTDSLKSSAYLKLYCHTLGEGVKSFPSWPQYSGNTPWTQSQLEADIPPDTYAVWVWFVYLTPAPGNAHFDDTSFEVLGPATGEAAPANVQGSDH